MFRYNVKLALKSMRRNVILTALMIAAIGVGIGISMTTMTAMSFSRSRWIAGARCVPSTMTNRSVRHISLPFTMLNACSHSVKANARRPCSSPA